jgi:hypothetical protein
LEQWISPESLSQSGIWAGREGLPVARVRPEPVEDGALAAAGHGVSCVLEATLPAAEQWISPESLSQTGMCACREALPVFAVGAKTDADGAAAAAGGCGLGAPELAWSSLEQWIPPSSFSQTVVVSTCR